jgi:hypothetical protein
MTRDSRKNKEYFDKWIDFVQRRNINHDREQINTLIRDEGKAMCGDDLFKNSSELCVMRYSRGDAIPEMQDSVMQMIELLALKRSTLASVQLEKDVRQMYERLDLGTLYESLTLLAFMVSLRLSAKDVLQVLELVGHAGEDAILDRVAHVFGDSTRKIASQSKFSKIYDPLVEVMTAPIEQRAAKLKKYLEGWYNRMKPIYWHDNHEGAEGAYFGYWCFEAALVAMLFDVDDTSLRDHPHYPADLVAHFKNG